MTAAFTSSVAGAGHSVTGSRRAVSVCRANTTGDDGLARRVFLKSGVAAGLGLALVPTSARPALAEIRSYVEEFDTLVSATEAFGRLSILLERKDYDDFRQALRYPPMSKIRSSGVYLYMSLEEGSQQRADATKKYKAMMAGVEKIDYLAIQASRDLLKDTESITRVYNDTTTKMAGFVASVPVPQ